MPKILTRVPMYQNTVKKYYYTLITVPYTHLPRTASVLAQRIELVRLICPLYVKIACIWKSCISHEFGQQRTNIHITNITILS